MRWTCRAPGRCHSLTNLRYDAVIFDLDGTLVTTEQIHRQAWLATLPDWGISFAPDHYELAFAGRPGIDIAMHVLGLSRKDAERINLDERSRFWDLAPGRIAPIQGVTALIDRLAGVTMAVATSARREDAIQTLQTIGLFERFASVVTVDDVAHGKPHPEPFLRAAERAGVDPVRCVAFEDAPNGLRAARAAGMTTVGIGNVALLSGLADLVVRDYEEPSLESFLFRSA